jgi:DNA-binding MarR family transcriptional regulator
MIEGSDDPVRSVWQALTAFVFGQDNGRREVSRALDLSFVKVKALRRLARQPMSLSALAAALITDAPYTSVIVSDLERRGLVTRSPNPEDGRSKMVTATPSGRRAAQRAEAILGEPPPALRALNERDLAALDRIVAALLEDASGG